MRISIVVPVYNVERFICECLESIKKQTYSDFECILVDDGSTDSSGTICDRYAKEDERFKVFHKANGGLVSARKFGVNAAGCQYVCFVDSDDYIGESYLDNFANIIAKHSPDMIANNYIESFCGDQTAPFYINEAVGLYEKDRLDTIKERLVYDKDTKGSNMGVIMPSLCLKCIKRDLLAQQYSECDESISMGEDLMISFPLALICNSIYLDCFKGYFYRKNPNSIANTFKPEYFDTVDKLSAYLEDRMPSHQTNIAYYALQRTYSNVISAGRSIANAKEFKALLNQKITRNEIQKYKKLKTKGFPLKNRIFFFLIKKRAWSVLYRIIKLFS